MDTFETIIIVNGINYPGYVWFDTFRIVFDVAEIRYEIPFDWTSVQCTVAWETDEAQYYRTVYHLFDNNGNGFDFADYVNNYEQSTGIYSELFGLKKKEATIALQEQNVEAYRRAEERRKKDSELTRKIRQIEERVHGQGRNTSIEYASLRGDDDRRKNEQKEAETRRIQETQKNNDRLAQEELIREEMRMDRERREAEEKKWEEEQRLKEQREAEARRLEEELLEKERLEAEERQLEELRREVERQEAERIERERQEAEERRLEEEKKELRRQKAKERRREKARLEKERKEAEERRLEEERKAKEEKRLEEEQKERERIEKETQKLLKEIREKERRIEEAKRKKEEQKKETRRAEEERKEKERKAAEERQKKLEQQQNEVKKEKPKARLKKSAAPLPQKPIAQQQFTTNIPDCIYLKGRNCDYLKDVCRPNSFKCPKKYKHSSIVTPTTDAPASRNSGKTVYRVSREKGDFANERYGSNIDRKNLGDMRKSIPQIFLFRGGLKIPKDEIVDALITVSDFHGFSKTLYVAYNQKKKKIYMSYDQLDYYNSRKTQLKVKIIKSDAGTKSFDTFDTFNEFHILSLYGYRVGKSGLSTPDREEILKFVFDNEILKGYEIIKHLKSCISLRENRTDRDFSEAIDDWKHDIEYVRNLVIKSKKTLHLSKWDWD